MIWGLRKVADRKSRGERKKEKGQGKRERSIEATAQGGSNQKRRTAEINK